MFDVNGNDNSTYNIDNIELIKKTSPVVGDLIEKEYNRQKNNVELIASENLFRSGSGSVRQLSVMEICRRISLCTYFRQYKPLLWWNRIYRSA